MILWLPSQEGVWGDLRHPQAIEAEQDAPLPQMIEEASDAQA